MSGKNIPSVVGMTLTQSNRNTVLMCVTLIDNRNPVPNNNPIIM